MRQRKVVVHLRAPFDELPDVAPVTVAPPAPLHQMEIQR